MAAVERRSGHGSAESRALVGGISAAGALCAFLLIGTGFANYDTAYSLLWGADLAAGRAPDLSAELAPTPHPLATLLGILLSPLGDGAETAMVVLAFVALGAVTGLTYALGTRWFGPVCGGVAALIVITREPVLSFGVRAYVDLPYLAFVLGALWVEARRPRAGVPVLLLLGLAGLLRPEAWLFAGAYALWLRSLPMVLLAGAAPVIWVLSDWAMTGDPLHSLLDTRDNARDLQRVTGLDEVPVTVPRRVGEILREPVLLGAVIGFALAWRRERMPIVAGAVALVAFCVLAAAGLPILGRYLLLPAVLGAILCGAAVAAWRDGGWWRAGAASTVVALLVFIPPQVDRIERLRGSMQLQREIRDDLHAIAPAIRCAPVGVPTHRPVPLLALWLDRRPSEIRPARLHSPAIVLPRTERVARNFLLDRNDPAGRIPLAITDGEPAASNRSWSVYSDSDC